LNGEELTIFGDGSQTRSFCYRDDLAEGIIRMMNGPDDFCGPVNLGNPDEFTIRELAELTLELTGSKSKLAFEPLPADDPVRRQPDITLARERLGWEPKVKLREGLKKTIDWFRTIKLDDYRPPTPNY
jgi:UDP-glucuronate decarboxylase